MGAARAGSAAHTLAEGSFAVPVDDGITSGARAEKAPVLRLAVEVARLQLGAELALERLLPEGGQAEANVTLGFSQGGGFSSGAGAAQECQLSAASSSGVLRLSAALPLPGLGLPRAPAGGAPPPPDGAGEEERGRGPASVRIEVGKPGEDSPRGPRMDAADFTLTLEPHLGRWARLACAGRPADDGPPADAASAAAVAAAAAGEGLAAEGLRAQAEAEGCALAVGPADWGAALPLAVGAGPELQSQAGNYAQATLPHSGPGPEPLRHGGASSASESEDGSAEAAQEGGARLAWPVPAVPINWLLDGLLPELVPTPGRLSLALRRSATVGSAGGVLLSGLSAAQRARLSQLAVEWAPGDEPPCQELAQALLAEGFTRRGPLVCEEGQRTLLSFKREAEASSADAVAAVARTDRGGGGWPAGLRKEDDGRIWVRNLSVAVQHRFPVSRVVRPDAAANESKIGFSVHLPSFYEVWVEANSESARGTSPVRKKLGGLDPEQAFLLTLDPRPAAWASALAGAGAVAERPAAAAGLGLSAAARWGPPERQVAMPPGWAHPRHFVLPASAFPPSSAEGFPPAVPLDWVVSSLLGEHDVALLVLRDAAFDVRPWLAAGRHARSFRRVQLEATAGASSETVASSCSTAVHWAVRLGYSLLRGRCPGRRTAGGEQELVAATSELLFERLGG